MILCRFRQERGVGKGAFLALVAVLALSGVVIGLFKMGFFSQESVKSSSPFRAAPEFSLKDFKGTAHRLSELKGNVVMLHFWASWCPPCLDEIPHWVELATRYKDRGLRLVAISLDEKWEDAHKILPSDQTLGKVLSLLDQGAKASDLYGSYQFPETYLLSPRLEILYKWVGPQDWQGEKMTKLIEKALAIPVDIK